MREPPGPLWGRAASCCLLPRWCSGRRRARPLCVPVGGGPPASRPRCELRSARRLEARPGPATDHRHRGQAPQASRRPPIGRGACVLPGQALPPPTGTAAGPSGALHTSGAWSADDWLVVRPGPATAHRYRSRAYLTDGPSCRSLLSSQPISHAIPPRLFQIMNL